MAVAAIRPPTTGRGSRGTEVHERVGPEIPERPFRRMLKERVDGGQVLSTGRTCATRYRVGAAFGQEDDDGR